MQAVLLYAKQDSAYISPACSVSDTLWWERVVNVITSCETLWCALCHKTTSKPVPGLGSRLYPCLALLICAKSKASTIKVMQHPVTPSAALRSWSHLDRLRGTAPSCYARTVHWRACSTVPAPVPAGRSMASDSLCTSGRDLVPLSHGNSLPARLCSSPGLHHCCHRCSCC